MRTVALLLALLASPALAATVKVCNSKATTGRCASYNDTSGHGQLHGHKTVAVKITGTASVSAACIVGSDSSQVSVAIGNALSSTGLLETDSVCSDVAVTVDSCSSCSVDAWIASDW